MNASRERPMARRAHRRAQVWSYRPDRRTVVLSAIALALLASAVVSVVLVDYASAPERFPVRSLRFEGAFTRVTQDELMNAALPYVRGNFLLLDLDAVRVRVESLPWIRQATVRRHWPDSVYVYFEEQRLVAHWGTHLWLNEHAEIVDLLDAPAPTGLPRLDGPDGTQVQVLRHYRSLNAIAQEAGLDIAHLQLSPRRTWELRLSNGLTAVLGRGEPEQKLARFMSVYGDTVAARVEHVRRVDLRYTNGFSVQWAPGGMIAAAAEG